MHPRFFTVNQNLTKLNLALNVASGLSRHFREKFVEAVVGVGGGDGEVVDMIFG